MRESYPRISDAGLLIELNVDKSSRAYSVRPINVIFNRDAGKSLFEQDSSYMKDHILEISNLHSYSRKYRSIRTRKNNPRPILYYNTNIRNQIKYIIWSLAVNVTGFLKIRNVVKRLLGWDK